MLKHHLFATTIMVVIVVLSLFPVPEVESLEDVPFIDKWTHVVMYGALAVAMWLDELRAGTGGSKCRSVWVVIIPMFVGGALELFQPLVGRSCELLDFVADGVGAVLGYVIGWLSGHRPWN